LGAISPVPLYEFELRELFIAASVQSGCKWWTRYSRASEATVNVRQCLWSTRFVCRHYEGEYQKHPSDNSRASRQILRCSCPASSLMKAISVTILATSSSFCSHSSRFQSDPVRKNMPASARDDALSLIESLHIQWGKCSQGKLKRLSCAYTMQIANGGYARRKTATFVVRI
jgi:hypothetical protein